MDRGAWRATFHRVTKSQPCTTEDVHSDTIAELLSSLRISKSRCQYESKARRETGNNQPNAS